MIKFILWNKWSLLQCNDPKVIRTFSDFLSYKVNGRFTKNGNDTVSLLTKKNAFKTGFFPLIYNLLKDNYEISVQDNRTNLFYITEVDYTLPIGELRDNQIDCVKAFFASKGWYRGIINAATNYGKNWVITSILKNLAPYTNVVITVHRTELFEQLYEMFTSCGLEVSLYGTLGKESYKNLGKITLLMPTSVGEEVLSSNFALHMKSVGALIVDECHRATAKEYMRVLSLIDAFAVCYLSGTPYTDNPNHDLNVIGDSGHEIFKITNKDLIDEGISQRPTVVIHTIHRRDYSIDYDEEKQSIITCEERLQIIKDYILADLDKVILIPVAVKDHGHYLYRELSSLPTTVDFIYSGDPHRRKKLSDYKDGKIKVLISTEVLKEGVNIPNINILINAAWGKSVVWVKQFVGRLLRHDGISSECLVVDFIDPGQNTKQHSYQRLERYTAESFEIIQK